MSEKLNKIKNKTESFNNRLDYAKKKKKKISEFGKSFEIIQSETKEQK